MKSSGEPSLNTFDMFHSEIDSLVRARGTKEVYKAKTVFANSGELMPFVYYIHQGSTKHFIINSDGSTKLLYFLTPGYFYGETPCTLKTPTGLQSQAETDLILYKLDEKEYWRLLDESALFRKTIVKILSIKTLTLRYEIENITFNSGKKRLIRLFCSTVDTSTLADGGWYNLKLHYRQSDLGEIIGATRVTISRLMTELIAENFCRTINRKIQISAPAYQRFKAG